MVADFQTSIIVIGALIGCCCTIGFVTYFRMEAKRKANKKLSKKQKRELQK